MTRKETALGIWDELAERNAGITEKYRAIREKTAAKYDEAASLSDSSFEEEKNRVSALSALQKKNAGEAFVSRGLGRSGEAFQSDLISDAALLSSQASLSAGKQSAKNAILSEKNAAVADIDAKEASEKLSGRSELFKLYLENENKALDRELEEQKLASSTEKWKSELENNADKWKSELANNSEKWKSELADRKTERAEKLASEERSRETEAKAKAEAEKTKAENELAIKKLAADADREKSDKSFFIELSKLEAAEKEKEFDRALKTASLALEEKALSAKYPGGVSGNVLEILSEYFGGSVSFDGGVSQSVTYPEGAGADSPNVLPDHYYGEEEESSGIYADDPQSVLDGILSRYDGDIGKISDEIKRVITDRSLPEEFRYSFYRLSKRYL